jgi:Rgg/GadR/MutR family transcriptional activator
MDHIYGSVFKKIRKAKGFTIKEISSEDISASLLSKFENGKSAITSDKLIQSLHRLGVLFSEFEELCALESDATETFTGIRYEIQESNRTRNASRLLELIQQFEEKEGWKSKFDRMNIICAKGMLVTWGGKHAVEVNPSEVSLLYAYLMNVPQWSIYEHYLLLNTVILFKRIQLERLFEKLKISSQLFNKMLRYEDYQLHTLSNILAAATNQKWELFAQDILDYYDSLKVNQVNHLMYCTLIEYNRGLLEGLRGNTEKGIKKMRAIQTIFETMIPNSSLGNGINTEINYLIESDFGRSQKRN